MVALPPGTILQLMYLRERLRRIPAGRFVEIGPGSGEITSFLLVSGWIGSAYDLDSETVNRLNTRFAGDIAGGRLTVVNDDYLTTRDDADADLVISCMVMEHLGDDRQRAFMTKAASKLQSGGRMIGLVPASPRHWGIEDDIAGHCRRYTRSTLGDLAASTGWTVTHIAGLTFPLSNLLLPISNFLVYRHERGKLALRPLEQTMQSGRRRVPFKTHYPPFLGIILNEFALAPFHALQKFWVSSERALVYFEAEPNVSTPVTYNEQ